MYSFNNIQLTEMKMKNSRKKRWRDQVNSSTFQKFEIEGFEIPNKSTMADTESAEGNEKKVWDNESWR